MSQNRIRREHVIKIRVDAVEKSLLQAKADAAGLTITALLRDRIDQIAIVNRGDWQRRTQQLARIGTNLNQLVAWANSHKTAAEARQVAIALLAIERTIRLEFDLQQYEATPTS